MIILLIWNDDDPYISTIFVAMLWGYLPWNLGPIYIYFVGTCNLDSGNSHWTIFNIEEWYTDVYRMWL